MKNVKINALVNYTTGNRHGVVVAIKDNTIVVMEACFGMPAYRKPICERWVEEVNISDVTEVI